MRFETKFGRKIIVELQMMLHRFLVPNAECLVYKVNRRMQHEGLGTESITLCKY
jgi:hypothetical protein